MDKKVKEKLLKACSHAVSKNKTVVKTSWASGWPGGNKRNQINCPYSINPILAALFFIDPEQKRSAYNNGYYSDRRVVWLDYNYYWKEYNSELKEVENYLCKDKAWICGFILGWLYTPRKNTIRPKHLSIIPQSNRDSFKEGFKFAKSFRPLVTTIDVKRPKIKKKTSAYIRWSLDQGLKTEEIKTIVDEALAELVIDV